MVWSSDDGGQSIDLPKDLHWKPRGGKEEEGDQEKGNVFENVQRDGCKH